MNDNLIALLRATLHKLLADLASQKLPCQGPLVEISQDGGWEACLVLSPRNAVQTPSEQTQQFREEPLQTCTQPACPQPELPPLRPIEKAAFDAATTAPVSVKALARKAGYTPGSHFGAAVTHLCRLGLLVRVPDGVKLAPIYGAN